MSLIPNVIDVASNVPTTYQMSSSSSSVCHPQMSDLNSKISSIPTLTKSKSSSPQQRCQSCKKKKKLFIECKFCTLFFCCSCIIPEIHHCSEQKKCVSQKVDELSKTLMNGLCVADKVDKI